MTVSVRQTAFISGDNFNWDFPFGVAPLNGSLLAFFGVHWTNNPTIQAGFTQVDNVNGSNNDVTSAYKYAGASEPATQRPWTGANQGIGVAFELTGVTGTFATDVRSTHAAKDVTLSSDAFDTTAFNSGANGVGILALLNFTASTAVTETAAPAVTGGGGHITVDQSILQNTGVLRHSEAKGIHDYVATSGTSVTYHVAPGDTGQQGGAYIVWEVNNWTAPTPDFVPRTIIY